jgi:hypothetical protein
MSKELTNILNKSGKIKVISYKNKDKRKSFDENFGKNKMEIASKVIGNNASKIAEKLEAK